MKPTPSAGLAGTLLACLAGCFGAAEAEAPPGAALPVVQPTVQAPPAVETHKRITGLSRPAGLLVRPEGLFVTDEGTGRIWLLPPDAGSPQVVAGPDGGLEGPGAMAGDEAGNLFVAERSGRRVVCRDPEGRWLTVMGGGEATPGTEALRGTDLLLADPAGLAMDTQGDLVVLDAGWRMLLIRRADGLTSAVQAPGIGPSALASAPDGTLLVLDPAEGRLYGGEPGKWHLVADGLNRAFGLVADARAPWSVLETPARIVQGPDHAGTPIRGGIRPTAATTLPGGGWAIADGGLGGVLIQAP
ncbi:MAG: hypothetical protein VKP57_02525 [Candidatus Sericytochromatia bacterium]|nr:hypothetical protein [Candidatus Sericytochromatia bacterium]